MNFVNVTAAVMLLALTFGTGLQVNRQHLVAVLHDAWLMARVVLANVVIVPILGVLVARVFHLQSDVAIGFLLMAIAPGVPFILSNARERGGHLALAIALAFVLPVLSLFTIPITADLLVVAGGSPLHVPIGQFVGTLVLLQLVPLLAGMFVGERFPAFAPRLVRPLHVAFLVAVLVLLALLAPKILHGILTVFGSNGMLAMLTLVLLSIATGWLLGGPFAENRRILALGTALRNVGLCALIASRFPGAGVAATVMTYFLIQFLITTLFGAYFKRTAGVANA